MLNVNEINLLQAQNEGLKKQNKELQEEIKKYAAINEQETKDYAELKAENDRLKEEILKFRWDNPYFDLYNNVVNQRDIWEQKSEQYKSCLQEIKAIAEEYIFLKPDILTLKGDIGYIQNEVAVEILQLIDKAEV